MKNFVVLALVSAFAAPMAHANLSVTCIAKGKRTAQTGGTLLDTDAVIRFDAVDPVGEGESMEIEGVRGVIKVGELGRGETKLNENNASIGYFDIGEAHSNPDYRPRKYKNMVQFKDFNAGKTVGGEGGMWGNFLIDRELNDGCQAKYIFQAGDHMGGTVHFTCRVQD